MGWSGTRTKAALFLWMVKKTRISIEVIEEHGSRYIVSYFADGTVVRAVLDQKRKPRRRPRRPPTRVKDYTRKRGV